MESKTLKDYVHHLQENKIGCNSCKHVGTVAGSCHKSCNHEGMKELTPIVLLKAAMGIGSTNPTQLSVNDIPLQKWNAIGIEKGYVVFPVNFDPVWLEYCLMYNKKD